MRCEWFKGCPRPAERKIEHPKYGIIHICAECLRLTRFAPPSTEPNFSPWRPRE